MPLRPPYARPLPSAASARTPSRPPMTPTLHPCRRTPNRGMAARSKSAARAPNRPHAATRPRIRPPGRPDACMPPAACEPARLMARHLAPIARPLHIVCHRPITRQRARQPSDHCLPCTPRAFARHLLAICPPDDRTPAHKATARQSPRSRSAAIARPFNRSWPVLGHLHTTLRGSHARVYRSVNQARACMATPQDTAARLAPRAPRPPTNEQKTESHKQTMHLSVRGAGKPAQYNRSMSNRHPVQGGLRRLAPEPVRNLAPSNSHPAPPNRRPASWLQLKCNR